MFNTIALIQLHFQKKKKIDLINIIKEIEQKKKKKNPGLSFQ